MQTKEVHRPPTDRTYAYDAAAAAPSSAAVPPPAQPSGPSDGGPSRFMSVLVTPKINFSLPRRAHWKVPEDIEQDELRAAFLSRFPVRFAADRLNFRCATPAIDLQGCDRLVFRISAEGAEDDRVLLTILSELDKAYTSKFEGQLEQARADMLSSSMSFQVVADEIREGQAACQKRWEKETRSMKEHLSINQKRLFLLEQEKNQLQQTASASEHMTGTLRASVASLGEENAQLKARMSELESQLRAMSVVLATHLDAAAAPGPGGSPLAAALTASGRAATVGAGAGTGAGAATSTAATQTDVDEDARRWQQQLVAVSNWLQTGAALLQSGPATAGASPPAAQAGAAAPAPVADAAEAVVPEAPATTSDS